jgi:aminoglycoside phosphotransferase (APT) family kinase protein
MAALWTPERVADAALAKSLVEAQFPQLAPARIELLGEGWDNTVYRVNGVWAFRFPRRTIAVSCLENELRLLPAIAPRLPQPVPVPEWIGRPTEAYPWPFAGHRALPGRIATDARLSETHRAALASPLAGFLRVLHAIPAIEMRGLGASGDELGRLDAAKRTPITLQRLRGLAKSGGIDPLTAGRVGARLEQMPVPTLTDDSSLVHGDLYGAQILVDANASVCGIIDWGDIHIGHRAVDLAAAYEFLPPSARAVFLSAYGPVDESTLRFAELRALWHATAVAEYAVATRSEALLNEARLVMAWLSTP